MWLMEACEGSTVITFASSITAAIALNPKLSPCPCPSYTKFQVSARSIQWPGLSHTSMPLLPGFKVNKCLICLTCGFHKLRKGKQMLGTTDEWTNKWINEGISEWKNEWIMNKREEKKEGIRKKRRKGKRKEG